VVRDVRSFKAFFIGSACMFIFTVLFSCLVRNYQYRQDTVADGSDAKLLESEEVSLLPKSPQTTAANGGAAEVNSFL
jgi:hypothetical protein